VHRPAGVTWAGFRVMFAVRAYGQLMPKQLSELTSVSPASISSVLKTLEGAGMLTRTRGTSRDRRVVFVQLTLRGRRTVERLWREQHARERAWAQSLTPEDREALAVLARRVYHRRPTRPESASGDA
jgi:DNA-binding MarR family transcriptional regulator